MLPETHTFSKEDFNRLKEAWTKISNIKSNRSVNGIYVDMSPAVAVTKIREKSDDDLLEFVNNIHTLSKELDAIHTFIYNTTTVERAEEIREGHWEILRKKCEEDPMFAGSWNELMVLLKLEED